MKQAAKKKFVGCQYKKEIKVFSFFIFLISLLAVIGLIISSCITQEIGKETNETKEAEPSNEMNSTVEKPTTKKAELSAYGPSDMYYYDISYEDKVLIAKVVWAESRGECFEGKVAVASVILNRYYYGKGQGFDRSSIASVVKQPYQFASISNVSMENLEVNPDCMKAVEAACKGWDPTRKTFPNGAVYFYAPKYVTGKQAEIREGIKVLAIGNHNFHADFNKVN